MHLPGYLCNYMKAWLFQRLRLVTLVFAAALGLAAGTAVLALTEPPGPGLDPDAMQYLGAGAALVRGDGLRIPYAHWDSPDTTSTLAHFPPGFSATIAVGIAAGLTPQNSARFVMAVSAAMATAAVLLAAAEGGSLLGGFLAVVILAVTPAMVIVHASVLSEPLFLALFAAFVWQLTRPRSASGRTVTLGVLAAAAALVRYAGVSLVGAVLIDAWLGDAWMGSVSTRERPLLATRARRTAVALVMPVGTLVCWALLKPRSGDIRRFAFYGNGFGATLTQGVTTLAQWFAPGEDLARAGAVLAVVVAVALVALIVRDVRRVWAAAAAAGAPHAASAQRLQRALGIATVCYLGLVIASRLFADGEIPLDERILAPLFVLGALGVGAALGRWWFTARRGLMLLTAGIAASWVIASAKQSDWWVNIYREDGGDLAAREWRMSPLVDYAAALPHGASIYSNWPSALWFHTRRAARSLPEALNVPVASRFRAKMANEHAVLIAFYVATTDAASPDSLAMLAGLVPVAWWSDGVVWRAPADAAPLADSLRAAPLPATRRVPTGATRPPRPQ